jgi:DNA-binding ferritin-like protein
MVDDIAERIRKMGGTALRSIGDIARNQRFKDNDDEGLLAIDMLRDLLDDNRRLTRCRRRAHECVIATARSRLPASSRIGLTNVNDVPGS